jgi:8-oxo-dGTP diphosphatase
MNGKEEKPGREYRELPRAGVGAIVIHEGRILLVKRASSPGKGFWAIPGGLVELGETVREAAEREILEETGITVRAKEAFYLFDFIDRDPDGGIKYHYIIIDFLADYLGGEPQAADDALGVAGGSRGAEPLTDDEKIAGTDEIHKRVTG